MQPFRPTSVNESKEEAQTYRPTSISPPPPAKPPRIYDTPEGEDDVVYNDPVDVQPVEKKEKEDEEELYESPVWSSSEIQSFAEEGRPAPRKSITVISKRSTIRNPTPADYHYRHNPSPPYSYPQNHHHHRHQKDKSHLRKCDRPMHTYAVLAIFRNTTKTNTKWDNPSNEIAYMQREPFSKSQALRMIPSCCRVTRWCRWLIKIQKDLE